MKKIFVSVAVLWGTCVQGWTLAGAGIRGWEQTTLPVYYNFSECSVPETQLIENLNSAIAAWNTAYAASIRLSLGSAVTTTATDFLTGNASTILEVPVVICDSAFSANHTADPDYVPAATRLQTSGGVLNYAAVMLNAEALAGANVSLLSPAQVTVMMAHELGHVLGLGHSSVSEALMYFSLESKTAPILSEDDLDGMSFLYPRNEFDANPFGCASVGGQPFHPSHRRMAWVVFTLLVGSVFLGRLWSRQKLS